LLACQGARKGGEVRNVIPLAPCERGLGGLRVAIRAEARKLATHIVEPVIPPGIVPTGTELAVRILVTEDGKLATVQNPNAIKTPVLLAIINALHQWQFKPYIHDGKVDRFNADLIFHAP
jgi:hypothetical protein